MDTDTGEITMSVGSDATTVQLFAEGKNITQLFEVKGSPTGSVTVKPLPGLVDVSGSISIKSADAAGNAVEAATRTYTFDNVPPKAPSVEPNSTNGNVVVKIADTTSVASTVKLLANSSEISGNYVADRSVSGEVTFVPVAGQVVLSNQKLTATVADAVGNVSVASDASAPYTFENAIGINAGNAKNSFPAAVANYQFTLAEGTYSATIDGFGRGDKLVFKGAVIPSLNVEQSTEAGGLTDGQVVVKASTGSDVVTLTLINVGTADSNLLFESSFDSVFGSGTLTKVSNVTSVPSTPLTINPLDTKTIDASSGNFAYTLPEGQYVTTIKGFGAGDTINFAGSSKAALDLDNAKFTDGTVSISANFGSAGVVDLVLTELQPASTDESLNFSGDLNTVFGPGTLTTSVVGQVASQSVSISAGSVVQDASKGNFTYKVAEGSFKAEVSGFGSGDTIEFFGQTVATIADWDNDNLGDGRLLIVATTPQGSLVELTLSGLAGPADAALLFPSSFDKVFGAGSLIA